MFVGSLFMERKLILYISLKVISITTKPWLIQAPHIKDRIGLKMCPFPTRRRVV